ncbi:MAG: sulfite exporter TauE/SafE family protein [Ilumatobacteraceae bacterium]
MFTITGLTVGAIAALLVGLSKTALPGAAIIATPLLATVVHGRAITGTTLPILLAADLFAVAWYRHHARWDLLRPLVAPVAVGFGLGVWFFIAIGSATRPLDVTIGVIVLVMVALQSYRSVRRAAAADPSVAAAAGYGAAGGFTTFVSNTAGPIMNTYLVRLGLDKHEMIGTSAWFYFLVNVAKVPIYLALGAWSAGGQFFTGESLAYNLSLVPMVVIGAYGGRRLFPHLPQELFLAVVLVLSAAGAIKLLLP